MYSPSSDSWYGKYYRGGDGYQGRWPRSPLLDVDGCFLWNGYQYAEGLLAIKYRTKDDHGAVAGGPMHYILLGMGEKWRPHCYLLCPGRCLSGFIGDRNLHPGQLNYRIYPKYNRYFRQPSPLLCCLYL